MKIFDCFTVEERHFIVKEKNLIEVMKMIQLALSNGYRTGNMSVGNCGCAEESDVWFIHVSLTNNKWRMLLKECKDKKYQLVIKEDPNDMYFTKIGESN